jgi:hypothetical protein
MTPEQRFWSKVDSSGDCWLWTGALEPSGYARFVAEGEKVYIHRYAYEWVIGPIPEGLTIDHLCRVRHCVRPDHLEAVTHRENLRRSPTQVTTVNARKTLCPRGHQYSGRDARGWRECRECRRLLKARVSA